MAIGKSVAFLRAKDTLRSGPVAMRPGSLKSRATVRARQYLHIVGLCLVLAASGACVNHYIPVTATPAARQAYAADQVVLRIEEFQSLVIDLATSNQIPTPTARVIVRWTVAANTTIGQVPNGWQATVRIGWMQIRDEVARVPKLEPWVGVIDALLGGL